MPQIKNLPRFLNRAIFIMALLGMIIAGYVLQGYLRHTDVVCLNSGCGTVQRSPLSYLFGIPIPAFGFVGYFFITGLAFLRTTSPRLVFLQLLLTIACGGTLFVSWFTYVELFQIKAICTWCAFSAFIMILIFILSLKSYILEKKSKF